jgi:hypothetical protein
MAELTHYGVFCKKTVITKSTRFGPYPGKSLNAADVSKAAAAAPSGLEIDNHHMWEIFHDGRLSHFVDGSKSATAANKSNLNSSSSTASSSSSSSSSSSLANQWMVYVNCARFAQEQNLIAVQSDGEIYYEVCKDIAQVCFYLSFYHITRHNANKIVLLLLYRVKNCLSGMVTPIFSSWVYRFR